MSNIHFFGCSLVYGSEIDGEGINDPSLTNVHYIWPVQLAKKLSYNNDNIKIWARPGSSARDIAVNAIHQMTMCPDDVFIVCWTWPERTNYWNPAEKDSDQEGLIVNLSHITNPLESFPIMKHHSDLINHFKNYETARNWVLNFLQNFYLVESTAKLLNVKCIHLQMGETIEYLNVINNEFFKTQSLPHARFNKNNNLYTPTVDVIENHTLYKTWKTSDIVFRNKPLWYLIKELHADDNIYNGTHWNIKGSGIVADVVYNALKDIL